MGPDMIGERILDLQKFKQTLVDGTLSKIDSYEKGFISKNLPKTFGLPLSTSS